MTTPVAVTELAMDYGQGPVLRDVTFEVAAGTVFALLGPNGAGKTTTVEILEGYRRRTGGAARVLDVDPARGGRRFRDRIGIVLQSTAVDPGLTVIEAARSQARPYSDPIEPADALELLGLSDLRKRRVGHLSGGQRRRLDLALAIVGRPQVLFLDEPTTGFDPEARRWTWGLVRALRDEGITVLLTTHDLEEAASLADRIGILVGGRLVALGSLRDLTGTSHQISFTSDHPEAVVAVTGGTVVGRRVVQSSDDPRADLHRLTGLAIDRGWDLADLRVGPPDLETVYLSAVERD